MTRFFCTAACALALAALLGVIVGGVVHVKHSPRRFLNGGVDPDHGLSVAERRERYRALHAERNPRSLFGIDYEEVEFAGELGSLRGWLVPALEPPNDKNPEPNNNGSSITLIFAPGAGSTIMLEPMLALPLLRRHADVLAFDTASCGASDGECGVGFGNREWRDVLAAVEFVRARRPHSRIVLAGHSAGASASIHAASEIVVAGAAGGRVDGVIASSTFASLEDEAARVLVAGLFRNKLPPRVRWLVDALVGERVARLLAATVHLISWSHGEWLREPRDSLRAAAAVAASDSRALQLLIIHGGDDALVHVDNVERLAAAAASGAGVNVATCVVPRQSHKFAELWSVTDDTNCIRQSLERFFSAVRRHRI